MKDYHAHLSHPKYRPDIDGLRAIAVLAVVTYHAFPSRISGGFIGVDVFFVISGYLISTIIFDNLDKGTFSFSEFYARRIKRIFPALVVVLVSCFIFGWVSLLADEYKQLGKHIAAGAGFVSNIVLWSEVGYFDNSSDTKPLLHLWSLGLEEQFYILWPLLSHLIWKRGFNRLTIIFFAAALSFTLNIKGIKQDSVATFYSPQTRFWELLSGSLLAYLQLYNKAKLSNTIGNIDHLFYSIIIRGTRGSIVTSSNSASLVGLVLLVYGFWTIEKEYSFPGGWALVPVLGSMLIIAADHKSWVNRTILSNKVFVWFGLISYPLYLWHWPLLSFARIIESETPSRNIRIATVMLSVALAWLTYKLIERPVRFGKNGKVKVTILVLLMALIGFVGFITYTHDGFSQRNAVVKSGYTEQVRRQFMGPLWDYTNNNTCLNEFRFKDADKLAWWFCMKSKPSKPTLIILGTSLANQLYPGFSKNPALKHHSVLSIGTCDFAAANTYDIDSRNPCFGSRSTEQKDFIDNIVASNESIKFAIIDGLSRFPDTAYIERLKKRITFYESKGVRVILFTPPIQPGFHPKACFARPLMKSAKDCTFPLADRERLYDDFKPVIDALRISNPNVLTFEQNQIFCQIDKCSYTKDGMPLHRDDIHTSEYESVELQSYFNVWAKTHVPQIFDADYLKH